MPVPSRGGADSPLSYQYGRYIDSTTNLRNFAIRKAVDIRQNGAKFMDLGLFIVYGKEHLDVIDFVAAVPGIVTYASEESGIVDLAREHVTFRTALVACIEWLVANVPTTGTFTIQGGPNYGITYGTATPAQLEPFALLLDSLAATITPANV